MSLPAPHELVTAWQSSADQADRDLKRSALLAGLALSATEAEAYARDLKGVADHALRNELAQSFAAAELLLAWADRACLPAVRALGLLARANALGIGQGHYDQALPDYDAAADVYLSLERAVDAAKARTGQVYALSVQQHYARAIALGDEAATVLRGAGEQAALARLLVNISAVHGRVGDDRRALTCLDEARQIQLSQPGQPSGSLARIEYNRGIVLRNLGRFHESADAAQTAIQLAEQAGLSMDTASAREVLAVTYVVMGRYNDALVLFEQTLDQLRADRRLRDAALVELSVSDCLLRLGRLDEALERTQSTQLAFDALGGRMELGQAALFEAEILDQLGRGGEAQRAIREARAAFEAEGSQVGVAQATLTAANLAGRNGQFETSLALAEQASAVLDETGQRQTAAFARLIAARAALQLGRLDQASQLALAVSGAAESLGLPALLHPALHVLGNLARRTGDPETALSMFERAMLEVERLRGKMMIEHRVSFVQDKAGLYEDAVETSLALDQPARGLSYVDRAKSRALLDLLDHRLDLHLTLRRPEDAPLVDKLNNLRAHRDRLARRWEGEQHAHLRGNLLDGSATAQAEVITLEKQITAVWHQLLVRNADYAQEATLWRIQAEEIVPLVPPGSVLVEFFSLRDRWVAFVATGGAVRVHWLTATREEVRADLRRWALCIQAAAGSSDQARSLQRNAQAVLQRLFTRLLAPLWESLAGQEDVILVPHGLLHHVPFAALHDGRGYVIEQITPRVLPSASLLRHLSPALSTPGAQAGMVAVGYSSAGQLPAAPREAETIAALMGGAALLEDAATRSGLLAAAARCAIVHLATHAEFRPDNPLFSGLLLADGWLTTLDIFNWRLPASLVTLSACQTGRGQIGGGDEILGLLRAFLYAGARSIVASHWPVQDEVTQDLMERFYAGLSIGLPKAKALRLAQARLVEGAWSHPYFWAPFFLVGDGGVL